MINWKEIPEVLESWKAHKRGEQKHLLLMAPAGFSRMLLCTQDIPGMESIAYTTEAGMVGTFDHTGKQIRGLLSNSVIYCCEQPGRLTTRLLTALRYGKVNYRTATSEVEFDICATLWFYTHPRELTDLEKGVFTAVDLMKYINKGVIGINEFSALTDLMKDTDLDSLPNLSIVPNYDRDIPIVTDGGYRILDSGGRTDFPSGAVRDLVKGKGRYDLIPWEVVEWLAIHYEKGAEKYGERNWEKGIPVSKYYNSAKRHLIQHYMGLTDENHLMSSIWNSFCMYQTILWIQQGKLPEELYDLPFKVKLP